MSYTCDCTVLGAMYICHQSIRGDLITPCMSSCWSESIAWLHGWATLYMCARLDHWKNITISSQQLFSIPLHLQTGQNMHALTHTHDGAIKRQYIFFESTMCWIRHSRITVVACQALIGNTTPKRKLALNEIEFTKLCFWKEGHLKAALLFEIWWQPRNFFCPKKLRYQRSFALCAVSIIVLDYVTSVEVVLHGFDASLNVQDLALPLLQDLARALLQDLAPPPLAPPQHEPAKAPQHVPATCEVPHALSAQFPRVRTKSASRFQQWL